MSAGFYKRRRGVVEHIENGTIDLLEDGIHDYLSLSMVRALFLLGSVLQALRPCTDIVPGFQSALSRESSSTWNLSVGLKRLRYPAGVVITRRYSVGHLSMICRGMSTE